MYFRFTIGSNNLDTICLHTNNIPRLIRTKINTCLHFVYKFIYREAQVRSVSNFKLQKPITCPVLFWNCLFSKTCYYFCIYPCDQYISRFIKEQREILKKLGWVSMYVFKFIERPARNYWFSPLNFSTGIAVFPKVF